MRLGYLKSRWRGGGGLMTCFSKSIGEKDVEKLALGMVTWLEELPEMNDMTVVFRDSAFENDVAKTNVTEILRQYDVKDVRSL